MHFSRKEYRKVTGALTLMLVIGILLFIIVLASPAMIGGGVGIVMMALGISALAFLAWGAIITMRRRDELRTLRDQLLSFYAQLDIELKYAQGELRDPELRLIRLMSDDGTITLWRVGIDGFHLVFDTTSDVGELFVQQRLIDNRGETTWLSITPQNVKRWSRMIDRGVLIEPTIVQ